MTLNVLAISGSLRAASTNTMALRAAQKLAPPDIKIEIADIGRIPLFNGDLQAEGEPESVVQLKARIRAADAVLISTPEYNFSIPGVLKNALDWMSRPGEPDPGRDHASGPARSQSRGASGVAATGESA